MIVKILGIGDLFTAIIGAAAGLLPEAIVLLAAKWLIIKGAIFMFSGNYASVIDILCGVYFIFLAYNWGFTFLTIIIIIWTAQKGLASLI
jgi:hypothetical protein